MPTYGLSVIPSSIPPWAVNERIGTAAGRYALNTMLMPRTDSGLTYTDYRSGVMASGDGGSDHLAMQVNPAGGMAVTVNQGNAVINTQNQGAYMCCLDETKTLTLNASSGSSNRIDLVVARVYDDNNSALSGDADIRQFTVELVQGDASQSTATQPEPPAGAIPLAAVSVTKSLGSISVKQIADLRGPGLVARGGMRGLYGKDATTSSTSFAQPGAYPGDQRWVHNNLFQHQVYYGDPPEEQPLQGGWRGVFNALVFNNAPTGGGRLWAHTSDTWWRQWARVHIPYPGTPFMVYPSARAHTQLSSSTAAEGMICRGTMPGGTIFSWSGLDIGSSAADTIQTVNIAPIMWGPFTEAIDVTLYGHVIQTSRFGGGGIAADATARTVLSVIVFPSTVAPPGAEDQSGGKPQNPGVDGSLGENMGDPK